MWHPIKIWVDFTGHPSNHFSGCRLNGRVVECPTLHFMILGFQPNCNCNQNYFLVASNFYHSWKMKLSLKDRPLKHKFPDKTNCCVSSQTAIALVIKMTKVIFWAASKKKVCNFYCQDVFFLVIKLNSKDQNHQRIIKVP